MEYTVKPGDTIEKLAKYYSVSPERIFAHNRKLSQQPLPVGMRLIIPIIRQGLNNGLQ